MSSKHRKKIAALFAPKRVDADNRYGVHVLDNTAEEIMPAGPSLTDYAQHLADRNYRRRESAPDDPWLSPMRSEAVRALLLFIQAAQHSPNCEMPPDGSELDLEAFCRDAKLDEAEIAVVSLAAEGWTQCQVADWLEISQATVSRRLSTGRRKLTGWLPVAVAHRLLTI